MQNYSVEIAGKEQIRTLPDMQDLLAFMLFQYLPQLIQRVVLDEQSSLDIYAKGVIRQKGNIFFDGHDVITLFRDYGITKDYIQHASEGILQSPRGLRLTPTTFGPSGMAERLNCC